MGKVPVNAHGFEHKGVPLYHTVPWAHAEELDAQEILDNGGVFAAGAAGTGKSYLLHELKGLVPDATVCAYTHTAARLVGRSTVAHVLLSLNTWGKWISVDEVSLLPLDALGTLARLKLCGAKFVLLGDYDGQSESVSDR